MIRKSSSSQSTSSAQSSSGITISYGVPDDDDRAAKAAAKLERDAAALKKKCEPIENYIRMSLDALSKQEYSKAKNYATMASMLNKRLDGPMDTQLNKLYSEAGNVAGGIISAGDERLERAHYFAAHKEYEDVASLFSYVDQGEKAQKKIEDLKASLRGKNTAELMTAEAEDVFEEMMSFLSNSWRKNSSSARKGGKLAAIDIVRAMSDTERIELAEKIESLTSLYKQTQYGQKALKLRNDIRLARINMD